MGTVLPVGVVKALRNRHARLLEGLAAGMPGGYPGTGLSTGSLPGLANAVECGDAGALVTAGRRLQPGRCSGARCSRAGSGGISVRKYTARLVPRAAGRSARSGCPLWEADFVPEGRSSERVYKVFLYNE